MNSIDKLRELVKIGWNISLDLSENDEKELGIMDGSAIIGDINCPIAKEYDPDDYHGCTIIDFIDLFPDDIPYWEKGIDQIYYACKEAEKRFGSAK